MTLVSSLSGSFGLAELRRLKFPVAWCGTVPADEQESQESALHDFASEAIEQLQEAYDSWELKDGQELEVVIENGEIVGIIVTGQDGYHLPHID